ncbi:mannitol dehydrogenase family protein [Microbacterium immunditiarum]|uniref:Mannitol-1-phosphate 5-dehydrogenase n=1 Tax=Microbacterium immunditiarum TaxID=337480 RepID=A0A7Y9GTX5_9MICO|nr:fructuronate reductase [Microbacterium immunditiarum]
MRVVHVGLGAFHRAHQAWYTDVTDASSEWGIAAFSVRSQGRVADLADQGGLYTVVERAPDTDRARIVGSIAAVHHGADLDAFVSYLADPAVSIVTATVTESGYRIAPDGRPLNDPAVDADIAALRSWTRHAPPPPMETVPGRLLLGLQARRRADVGPISIVPCDNLPSNGSLVRSGLLALADRADPQLVAWIADTVAFVSTVVDRITPAASREVLETAHRLTGLDDRSPVVTEPYHEWILAGDFPLGRPEWERAGARFVEDVEPFERRKLVMLNGAHTILAAAGIPLGHETVAEAIGNPVIRDLVERFWNEAARSLLPGADPDSYQTQLVERFANPRIRHRLEQIAADSTLKVRLRVLPVLEAELASGRSAEASAEAIAAWLKLARLRPDLPDPAAQILRSAEDTVDGDLARLAAVAERLTADQSLAAHLSSAARSEPSS